MHAIWLTFSKGDREYLKKIIDEISEKYHAPKFEPHITVYGLVDSKMKLIDSIAEAVKSGADFNTLVLKYSDDEGSRNKISVQYAANKSTF